MNDMLREGGEGGESSRNVITADGKGVLTWAWRKQVTSQLGQLDDK